MVRIRMHRYGRRHRPFYRIAAVDQRTRRGGRVIEPLGYFDPLEKDESKALKLNEERISHWLSVGAQPSESMADILGKRGLLTPKLHAAWEKERAAVMARQKAKDEANAAAKAAEEEAARKAAEEEAAAKAAEEAAKKAEAEAAAEGGDESGEDGEKAAE